MLQVTHIKTRVTVVGQKNPCPVLVKEDGYTIPKFLSMGGKLESIGPMAREQILSADGWKTFPASVSMQERTEFFQFDGNIVLVASGEERTICATKDCVPCG